MPPTFRQLFVVFLFVALPMHLVGMALGKWGAGNALTEAISLWLIIGAMPVGMWRIHEVKRRATDGSPPGPLPTGFAVVAGLVVFSAGVTSFLAFPIMALPIIAWEMFVVAAVVALEWSRRWVTPAVLAAAGIDLALTAWGYVQLSRVWEPNHFPLTLVAVALTLHGLRAPAVLAMLGIIRRSEGGAPATAPAV